MDKKITIIGRENSIFNQFMYELREVSIQGDRMRFRKNLLRCSQIMAYELSKHLAFQKKAVTTPLGELEMELPVESADLGIHLACWRADAPGLPRLLRQCRQRFHQRIPPEDQGQ